MAQANPIAESMEILHDQWVAFTSMSGARLLIWRATSDETVMVDAFAARESDASTAQTPDLFLQLRAPFTSEDGHGFALMAELCTRYEAAVALLDDDDQLGRWHGPHFSEDSSDVAVALATFESFRQHHARDDGDTRLAVWIEPSEVYSTDAFALWLQRLIRQAPSFLRFFVVDDILSTDLTPLAEAEPERVVAVDCGLGVPGALETLASGAGGGTPGDRFRLLQTQLGVAVGTGDLQSVRRLATTATQLAVDQGWPQLAAGIQMMLAAGCSKGDRPLDALGAYGQAEQHALHLTSTESAADGQPSATKLGSRLRLAVTLGRGAVLLKLQSYQLAADTYTQVASLARVVGDMRTELDGYRLAAVCYSLLEQADKAWAMGMHGLQFALGMDEDTRATSTLPYLADQLLRMTTTERGYASYRKPLEQQMSQLLGPDWQERLVQTATV